MKQYILYSRCQVEIFYRDTPAANEPFVLTRRVIKSTLSAGESTFLTIA